MQNWTQCWNLYFNVAKCMLMHIGKKNENNNYHMKIEKELQKLEKMHRRKGLGDNF